MVAGLAFLALAVLGKIPKIDPGPKGRVLSGGLGAVLLLTGLFIHLHHAPVTSELACSSAWSSSSAPFFMGREVASNDMQVLSICQADLMRNEIYARHGRRFQRSDLQHYFDRQPWYRPLYSASEFPENELTDVQRKIDEFLAKYAKR